MAEEFFIPQLGQTVEHVTLVRWLVEDGEKVIQGREILEVETDKAIFPVEANGKGYIHIGPFSEGDVVPVLTVVALIGTQEDTFKAIIQENDTPVIESEVSKTEEKKIFSENNYIKLTGKIFISPRAKKLAIEKNIDLSQITASGFGGKRIVERDLLAHQFQQPKISPVAKRIASESGIAINNIIGSGPNGRIVKDDVISLINQHSMPKENSGQGNVNEITEKIPLVGIRKIIAERMAISVHTTARVTLTMEVDATDFVNARMKLKEKVENEWGFSPGYNDFLAKIVSVALRQYPYMNARITSDNIEILERINIGIAVDTERGLLVPVIKDVDKKNFYQLGKQFREMVDRSRNNRSLPDDLTGGTFTITNLGGYGVDAFTPVINLPEAAILGVGQIASKVVPRNGEITIRNMLTLSLVFDHRLIDGAPAARFLQAIKKMIEEPILLLGY